MNANQLLLMCGAAITNEIKIIVAINQTSIIEQTEIKNLDLFFSFKDTGGLKDVKSVKLTPYNSAKQDKMYTSGRVSPLSHLDTALSE